MAEEEYENPPSRPLPANQEWFETELVNRFIRKNEEVSQILEAQFATSVVVERWGSGAGVYIDYRIANNAPPLPNTWKKSVDGVDYSLSIFDPLVSNTMGWTPPDGIYVPR